MTDYTDKDLQGCVNAGILSGQQYADIKAHVHGSVKTHAQRQDSEYFRLISGFNDIFVVVACALVLGALGSLVGHLTGLNPSVGIAIGAWLLAEYFVRRRHMALPAVVLALSFGIACLFFFGQILGLQGVSGGLVGLFAAALQGLFWWRFRIPVTIAVIAGCFIFSVQLMTASLFGSMYDIEPQHLAFVPIPFIQLIMGIAVFVLAMFWDVKDPERKNYRSDVAFWLHILAAPLIVSGVFSFTSMYGESSATLGQAIVVTLLYAFLAMVSLWVDRRALMLAALSILVFTYSSLLAEFGVVGLNFAITGLVVGVGLLLLSVYWQRCRTVALKALPARLQQWTPNA